MKTMLSVMGLVVLQFFSGRADAQEMVTDSPPGFRIAHITLLIKDYDEALKFYTEILGFEKRDDIRFGGSERWVTVSPPGQNDVKFVFVQAVLKQDKDLVGKQAGSRTFAVINTSNCYEIIEHYRRSKVTITAEPAQVPWGTQAQFKDLYGNNFVVLEPKAKR